MAKQATAYIPRLKDRYFKQVVPSLMKEHGYSNPMAVPRLKKIVINCGVGRATENIKLIDKAKEELAAITGQAPLVTKARIAIASFKLKQGQPIGVMVTLRRNHMYEFFDRLINIALPRVRDFRGIPRKGFDGNGNYTLGIREQTVFPEIVYDKVDRASGMNVTIETSAKTDAEGVALLKAFGFPFREN